MAAGTLLRGEFRPGGVGARVVRPGGAAAPAAPVAGAAASRGRAGRAGRAGALPAGVAGRGVGGRRRSIGWPRSSRNSRACRCRRAPSSATSCRRGFAAMRPACSTSWEPPASWSGWASGRSVETTVESRSTGRTGWRCCWPRHRERRPGPPGRPGRPKVKPPPPTAHRPPPPRRHLPTTGSRRPARPPCVARRLVLPRSARGRAASRRRARPPPTDGARTPRRAVGPRLDDAGHQRHVRPVACPALAASRPATTKRRTPPARRDRTHGSARGCRPLVARAGGGGDLDRAGRRSSALGHGAPPRPCHAPPGAARGGDTGRRRGREPARWLRRGLSRSCGNSRSAAACDGATSSRGSAAPSSPCRGPSIGCARNAPIRLATAGVPAEPCCWRPRIRPTRTAARCRGRAPTTTTRRVLARAAGAYVVLHDGDPMLYLERGGRSLLTLPGWVAHPDGMDAAARALAGLVEEGRLRSVQVERIDGIPAADSPLRSVLIGAGFHAGYRGLMARAGAR